MLIICSIFHSNGLLDPWSSGGILEDINDSVKAFIIPQGAHHLDLRSSEAADPQSVRDARKFHAANVKQWILQYHKHYQPPMVFNLKTLKTK